MSIKGDYAPLRQFVYKRTFWDWLRACGVRPQFINAIGFFLKVYQRAKRLGLPPCFTYQNVDDRFLSICESLRMKRETARRFVRWCCKRGLVRLVPHSREKYGYHLFLVDYSVWHFLIQLCRFAKSFKEV